ncbi:50S ribosomal protein L17, partial [Candidatus Cerribacteria bacterium 'Amazon FNV 2010 28 9']
ARFFGTRAAVNRLVDEVAPAMKDRTSGFTRITRLGKRMGDDSMMVRLELVNKPAVKAPVAKATAKVAKEVKEKTEVKS